MKESTMQSLLLCFAKQFRLVFFLSGIALGLFFCGCAEKAPHMDTSQTTSSLNHPGVCEHCQKKIEKVTEENFLVVRGNRYIVCDEACGVEMKKKIAKQ